MSKSVSIQLKVYTLDEACERLAVLAKHKRPRYSRGGFYNIVRKYKPELIEPLITEGDLEFLADRLKKPGRPPKIIDKSK
ncbi:hypothetical protein ES706_06035 [subsurface metagenome]